VDALISETANPAAKTKIPGERSLLIVEDDQSFSQRLAKALEQRGFIVTTADSVAFNVQPRKTGQILIGSSRQFGVDDGSTEAPMLTKMLARVIEYMPSIRNLSMIRTWTGFRAATPDNLPLIGVCPGYKKVYLATGHEGLGISTSLATARLLADEILGRVSAIARAPYEATRRFVLHA